MGETRLHSIWSGMIERCKYTNCVRSKDYALRGIKVCEEWHNFDVFEKWALSNGYTDELSIDRINNDKGYYPENCKWSTAMEQANNRRNNHFLEYNGKRLTVMQWSRELGIDRNKINRRLKKGLPIEEVLKI